MSVSIDCRVAADEAPLRVETAGGSWVTAVTADPEATARAIAGTGPGTVRIVLDGQELSDVRAPQRSRAGLAVALCRLDPMPTLRVADVLLLGLRAPRPHLWQTLAGTRRARTMMHDDEAQVRALAGRLGVAEWVDAAAVDLPPEVQALGDITRALASSPRVLVLRRPTWVDRPSLTHIEAVVREEQQRDGFAVLELTDVRSDSER